MSKRTRTPHNLSLSAEPPRKLRTSRLSDGVSERTIELFANNRTAVRRLLSQLQDNQLSVYQMSGCTDFVLGDISRFLPSSSLQRLVLVQGEMITVPAINELMKAITKSRLLHLDLRENSLQYDSIGCIVQNLPTSHLISLNLGSNGVDLQCFLDLPRTCSTITKLLLDSNHFSNFAEVGPVMLQFMPQLSHLSLVDCNLTGDDIKPMIPSFRRHMNLKVIHLSCNPLREGNGLEVTCELIQRSIALQEIHLLGNNYSKEENQKLINALASREESNLKIYPNRLTRRANYLKRIYPGKEELYQFLAHHKLEDHAILFFRFKITLECLKDNAYLLPSLEKYQLDHREISVIENAIQLASQISRSRKRGNTLVVENYEKKCLMGHLLILDVVILPLDKSTLNTCGGQVYQKGLWANHYPVQVRSFGCTACNFYQLQAAGNRLFRLRHPNVLDFLGMYLCPSATTSRVSKLNMVFEDISFVSLKEWLYTESATSILTTKQYTRFLIKICREVAQGMEFIAEQQKLFHFELSLDRIALSTSVDGEITPKILDFGLDCFLPSDHHVAKDARWLAPEGKSKYADIWMFAIFVWELFTHAHNAINVPTLDKTSHTLFPFHEISDQKDLISMIMAGAKVNMPERCPPDIYSLICDATNPTPSKRPTFSEMLKQLLQIEGQYSLSRSGNFQSIPKAFLNFEDVESYSIA